MTARGYVSPLFVSPTLTLSPIWPLSPGAPLIPLGPLGPWEMKETLRSETCDTVHGSYEDFVCFCERRALNNPLSLCGAHLWSRWAFISSVARRPSSARLALENKTNNETQ